MKHFLILILFLHLSLWSSAQDTVKDQDTASIRTYYTSGRNFNIDVFGITGTHKADTTYVSGFGLHSILAYQFNGFNVGLGTGIENYNNNNYIPFFGAFRFIMGNEDLRFFFFMDYGFLNGKPFKDIFETGQFGNLGVGFSFFLSNYQTLNISAGWHDVQVDKAKSPRESRRDMMFLVKLGYSVY